MIKHLYIHVPFCKTICSYCDFAHVLYKQDLVDRYLDKLDKDIKQYNNEYETIYIGGGTPSCLSLTQLKRLLEIVKPYTNKVIEYTIEINPETLDIDKIKLIKEYGINRVSIGLQSSNDNLLKLMNRHHTYDDVKRCVKDLKSNGIDNISIDVMYSLPTQTMDDLKKTIDDVLVLDIPHISLYSLTIEKGTIFDKLNYKSLDEDLEADMYEYIESTLKDKDYIHYEIANFSKEGKQSRHNLGYWNYDDFIGLGPGSSSKENGKRYTITRNIEDYINNINLYSEYIDLSLNDECFENVMMSLRTIYGLDLELFKQRYNIDFKDMYKNALSKNSNYLDIKDNHLICNNLEILNTILIDFMD